MVLVHVPHATIAIDPRDHDVHVVFSVTDHHPGVMLKAHLAHVLTPDQLPLRVGIDTSSGHVSLTGSQAHLQNRPINVASLVDKALHLASPSARLNVSFPAHRTANNSPTLLDLAALVDVDMLVLAAWPMQVTPDRLRRLPLGDLGDHGAIPSSASHTLRRVWVTATAAC